MQTGRTSISVGSLINSLKLQSTRNEKTQWIHCPCKKCKNLRVFNDPTTIRSHVMVCGFVKDYTIWKKHGETDAPPPANSTLDQIILDEEFDRMFDAYIDDGESNDGVGDEDGVGGFHGDDVGKGPSMVTAVMMNLMMLIFLASCCAIPKRRYWLVMPGG